MEIDKLLDSFDDMFFEEPVERPSVIVEQGGRKEPRNEFLKMFCHGLKTIKYKPSMRYEPIYVESKTKNLNLAKIVANKMAEEFLQMFSTATVLDSRRLKFKCACHTDSFFIPFLKSILSSLEVEVKKKTVKRKMPAIPANKRMKLQDQKIETITGPFRLHTSQSKGEKKPFAMQKDPEKRIDSASESKKYAWRKDNYPSIEIENMINISTNDCDNRLNDPRLRKRALQAAQNMSYVPHNLSYVSQNMAYVPQNVVHIPQSISHVPYVPQSTSLSNSIPSTADSNPLRAEIPWRTPSPILPAYDFDRIDHSEVSIEIPVPIPVFSPVTVFTPSQTGHIAITDDGIRVLTHQNRVVSHQNAAMAYHNRVGVHQNEMLVQRSRMYQCQVSGSRNPTPKSQFPVGTPYGWNIPTTPEPQSCWLKNYRPG